MIGVYMKMALHSIGSARWRSFLTMLGVVVGVVSVVTIISLGDGVQRQLSNQINHTGQDLITVRPGRLVERDKSGAIKKINLSNLLGNGSLSENDVETVKKNSSVGVVVPFGLMSGVAVTDEREAPTSPLIGTTPNALEVLNQKIYGSFFNEDTIGNNQAVIGHRIAQDLFDQNLPIGRAFKLRDQTIIVVGVFEPFTNNPLSPGIDYNNAIFLPYKFAKQTAGGQLQIYQVLARPAKDKTVIDTVDSLNQSLTSSHGGQNDFTVLQAADNLAIATSALSLLTNLVSVVAAISLVVGGIGIMNIMLVSVSERTQEIGVRKSVGATNKQILGQFLTEAIVISGVGGLLGVLGALFANYLLRLTTGLEPTISPVLMAWAVILAVAIGSFFGITPAIKAAKKDPIEALRQR